jgi:hypothetical protein
VQTDCDRRNSREDDARRAEEGDRRKQWVQPRAGIPLNDRLEDGLVEHRDRKDAQSAEAHDHREEPRLRPTVGEDSTGPVADREAGEDDADQRAPDE